MLRKTLVCIALLSVVASAIEVAVTDAKGADHRLRVGRRLHEHQQSRIPLRGWESSPA